MERFTIAPDVVDKLNTSLKEPRTWRGRFAVPVGQVHSIQNLLNGDGFKRPIIMHLDEVNETSRVAMGDIAYGPVKGANKNDMDRFMARFDGKIIESLGTAIA